jgi:hypothetical protein
MKRLCSLLIVIALLLILFAGGTPKVQKNLEYRLTEKGSDIAVRDPSPSIAVFTEEGDFNTFYNYLHMNKIPLPGPPEIDFSGSLLLFVSYGEQRTAGYFIEVKKVYDRKGTLVVQAVLLGPPEGSMSAQETFTGSNLSTGSVRYKPTRVSEQVSTGCTSAERIIALFRQLCRECQDPQQGRAAYSVPE